MSRCSCWTIFSALAVLAVLHRATASSVVFDPADEQRGVKISPAKTETIDAKAVWYKCGFKTWDRTEYKVQSVPATQDFTVYFVRKSDVRNVGYKADGSKRYPLTAKAKCSRQTYCEKTVAPEYFNYYTRCLVVSSDSTTTPLTFTVSATSKIEIKVFVLWGGVALVGFLLTLTILNCLCSCFGCCSSRRSRKHTRL